jgi:hypothetical protein
MLEALPLLVTTLLMIGVFSYAYATIELKKIRANWNTLRCDPLVVLIAQMVPTDPNINASEFATENFKFCTEKLVDASISIFIKPMLQLFTSQLGATDAIKSSINYLKTAATSLLDPINDSFNNSWSSVKVLVYQIARVFYNIHSAMDRIFGIATASVFAGISLFKGIQNAMGFVIQIIIAILIVLCILVIFLYFVMWPVIPLILTMIGILSTSVYAANVSGMADSFCVAPDTLVKMADGWKKVRDIVPGDKLNEGVVEGVLKTTGSLCVEIEGVIISRSHLVYTDKWISAGNHPLAKNIDTVPDFLYCLNTSNHIWEVKSSEDSETLLLRDWEELPDGFDLEWEHLVYNLLNKNDCSSLTSAGRGLTGPKSYVINKSGHTIPITEVQIGDYIKDGLGLTKVIGLYKDTATDVPLRGPNPSAWVYRSMPSSWEHVFFKWNEDCICKEGYQLITESGQYVVTFSIGAQSQKIIMRDFTEVGADEIYKTYHFTSEILNNVE